MSFDFGVSSACFYPLETEKSFLKSCELGFKNIEIFFNSPSELSDEFISDIQRIKDKYEVNIPSVHPFQSFAESFYIFSNYERRFYDILPLYDRYLKVTSMLGADIFVIHGAKKPGSVDDEEYCKRFMRLMEMGDKYGVRVCHENVVYYRSESPDYLKMMSDYIGSDFKTVFDIKQAYRAGYTPYDFLEKLHDTVVHVHISDHNAEKDCCAPCSGDFNFEKFFKAMKSCGYAGKYIIELYNWSYDSEKEITDSCKKLEKIVENI